MQVSDKAPAAARPHGMQLDSISVAAATTWTGGPGGEEHGGGNASDRLSGMGGDDTLSGAGGSDTLLGGVGDDVLIDAFSVDGRDRLVGAEGDDIIQGWKGDVVDGGAGYDTFQIKPDFFNDLPGGVDHVDFDFSMLTDGAGKTGGVTFKGVEALDFTLWTRGGDSRINTGQLDARIFCGSGDDLVTAVTGKLTAYGLEGDDTLTGGSGDDVLEGNEGRDQLTGGAGDDFISGGIAFPELGDRFLGGKGIDTLRLFLDPSQDHKIDLAQMGSAGSIAGAKVSGFEKVTLILGDGDNKVVAGDYEITVAASRGSDTILGGAGSDTFRFYNSWEDGAFVDLTVTAAQDTGHGVDILRSIENLLGTNAADRFYGNNKDNQLDALDGDNIVDGRSGDDLISSSWGADLLKGGGGSDTISAGSGQDTLSGGSGVDVFRFVNFEFADSTITDFRVGEILDFSSADPLPFGEDDAFTPVASFTGDGGQVIITYEAGANRTVLTFDRDVNGVGDTVVRIEGGDFTDLDNFIL